MLSQKVLAVVIAVGRAKDHVDVVLIGLHVLAECNPPLVVELHDEHRTLDTVVEYAVVFYTAHPAEIGLVKISIHFRHLYLSMIRPHAADVQLN